jgi:hypothetical protein
VILQNVPISISDDLHGYRLYLLSDNQPHLTQIIEHNHHGDSPKPTVLDQQPTETHLTSNHNPHISYLGSLGVHTFLPPLQLLLQSAAMEIGHLLVYLQLESYQEMGTGIQEI